MVRTLEEGVALTERSSAEPAPHPGRGGPPGRRRDPQLWALTRKCRSTTSAACACPTDVTLLWAEDNWGNIRRLRPPRTQASVRRRRLLSLRLPRRAAQLPVDRHQPDSKIAEQMRLAKAYGAESRLDRQRWPLQGLRLPTEYSSVSRGTPRDGRGEQPASSRACGGA